MSLFGFFVALCVVVLWFALITINEYERGVVFRFGRITVPRGPGLRFIIPFIEELRKVDIRTITMDVPEQDIITRDNVSVKVNAVLYFKVVEVIKAIVEVENYTFATSQLAQTTLRSVCGEYKLDDLLNKRETINIRIAEILDNATDPWGIKVEMVEIKHIDLPENVRRVMGQEAEAERERRAKIINAEGEYQASQRLTEAARVLATEPLAIQLRYLQTLREIAAENNSTTIFPLPIELLSSFISK
jgi:regulator of protease activity HflC (stomatin/prohibitin superfamily)